MTRLREYYDPEDAPGDALGRAARTMGSRGGMYLGGGVGVERVNGEGSQTTRFAVMSAGGRTEHYAGPLSAMTRGFEIAGRSTAEDSPGGSTPISSPASAARVRELRGIIAARERDVAQYRASVAQAKKKASTAPFMPGATADSDQSWEERSLARCQRELQQARAEMAQVMARASTPMQEALSARSGGGRLLAGARARVAAAVDTLGPVGAMRLVEGDAGDGALVERVFADMALLFLAGEGPPPVVESAKTAALSSTHAPIGKGGTNWITRSKPGNAGQLPAYIQNVRNAIMRGGTDESRATAIAIGRIRDWAEGKGRVGPEVKAAAAKAIAEWEAMRAKSHATSAAKGAVKLAASFEVGAALDAVSGMLLAETFGASQPTADAYKVARAKGLTVRPATTGAVGPRWDPSKHPRGARGSGTGGKFIAAGSSGTEVRAIQRRVGAKVDGQFGAQTRAEIEAFQRRHGLAVDGVVGRQTATALRGNVVEARRMKPGALRRSDLRAVRRLPKLPARRAPKPPMRSGGGIVV